MKKVRTRKTGMQELTIAWMIFAVLFLGVFIRPVNVQASKVKLNKSTVTIYRGVSTSLKVSGSKKKVKWSSSKKSVVSVSSGKVNRYTEQSIRLMLKKYTGQAGIERNITPHMFRHSFATYLIEEGVDVSCVQQILGHSSIKTTQIYIHIAAKKQAEILREMHPRNNMSIVGAA